MGRDVVSIQPKVLSQTLLERRTLEGDSPLDENAMATLKE